MTAVVEKAMEFGANASIHRRSGQMNLFGKSDVPEGQQGPSFPDIEPWSDSQLLNAEKETLGFYISSHPLVKYGRELSSLSHPTGVSLGSLGNDTERFPCNTPVRIGCSIRSVRPTFTKKKGEKMAMLTLEDITGKLDAVVFPRTYTNISALLEEEQMIFVTGMLDRSRNRPQIIIEEVTPIDRALEQFTGAVKIRLPGNENVEMENSLQEAIRDYSGSCPVILETRPAVKPDLVAAVKAGENFRVQPSRELVTRLEEVLGGQDYVLFIPREVKLPDNGRRNFRAEKNGRKSAV
jgi:DNA polymerase-3 subunit alpha